MKTETPSQSEHTGRLRPLAFSPAGLFANGRAKTEAVEARGAIQSVDAEAQRTIVSEHRDETERTFLWGAPTTVIECNASVAPGLLKNGQPVQFNRTLDGGSPVPQDVQIIPVTTGTPTTQPAAWPPQRHEPTPGCEEGRLPPHGASASPKIQLRVQLAAQPPRSSQPRRILIADDDGACRELFAKVLAREGYCVREVADGEAAWVELHREHYDLLVTDNEMPKLSGVALIERMRQTGMNLPVVVASGSFSVEEARSKPDLQIAEILSKPFALEDLSEVVRDVLEGARFPLGEIENHPLPRSQSTQHRQLQPKDHAVAREWCSRFQHEATFAVPPGTTAVPKPQPQPAQPQLHHRILVVDDDALVRGSLAAVLESEGYAVDEASNGIEAVAHANEHRPDVVLLDLNMPNCEGWTTFNQLDRVTPLVPVIIITARPHQYETAVKLGVDAFMEKPLNFPILLRAIRHLVTEDADGHTRRITDRGFVTKLLNAAPRFS